MKRSMLALVVMGLLVVASAPAALATTTKMAFAGTSTFVAETDPGTATMAGSILSVRRLVWVYEDAGSPYVAGSDTVVINYDLDLVTGSGSLWGKDRIEPLAFPAGAFDCSWHGTFASFVWTGRVVCHGEGSLAGWQLRADLVPAPGGRTSAMPGYVFLPGS